MTNSLPIGPRALRHLILLLGTCTASVRESRWLGTFMFYFQLSAAAMSLAASVRWYTHTVSPVSPRPSAHLQAASPERVLSPRSKRCMLERAISVLCTAPKAGNECQRTCARHDASHSVPLRRRGPPRWQEPAMSSSFSARSSHARTGNTRGDSQGCLGLPTQA